MLASPSLPVTSEMSDGPSPSELPGLVDDLNLDLDFLVHFSSMEHHICRPHLTAHLLFSVQVNSHSDPSLNRVETRETVCLAKTFIVPPIYTNSSMAL